MTIQTDIRSYEEKASQFIDTLPYGSGIDADWYWEELTNTIRFHNSYHIMENGFYMDWQDFYVTIKKADLQSGNWSKFDVKFENEISPHIDDNLMDYLEQTIQMKLVP